MSSALKLILWTHPLAPCFLWKQSCVPALEGRTQRSVFEVLRELSANVRLCGGDVLHPTPSPRECSARTLREPASVSPLRWLTRKPRELYGHRLGNPHY